MIYLHEKETGKRYSFSEDEIKELDAFKPNDTVEVFGSAMLEMADEKYGHWKMMLNSGRIFRAYGTTKEYDQVVRALIRSHTGAKI